MELLPARTVMYLALKLKHQLVDGYPDRIRMYVLIGTVCRSHNRVFIDDRPAADAPVELTDVDLVREFFYASQIASKNT